MRPYTYGALSRVIKEMKQDISTIFEQESFVYCYEIPLTGCPFHLVQDKLIKAFPEYDVDYNFKTNKVTIKK